MIRISVGFKSISNHIIIKISLCNLLDKIKVSFLEIFSIVYEVTGAVPKVVNACPQKFLCVPMRF